MIETVSHEESFSLLTLVVCLMACVFLVSILDYFEEKKVECFEFELSECEMEFFEDNLWWLMP